jgi:hypothetical protein
MDFCDCRAQRKIFVAAKGLRTNNCASSTLLIAKITIIGYISVDLYSQDRRGEHNENGSWDKSGGQSRALVSRVHWTLPLRCDS